VTVSFSRRTLFHGVRWHQDPQSLQSNAGKELDIKQALFAKEKFCIHLRNKTILFVAFVYYFIIHLLYVIFKHFPRIINLKIEANSN
jgi:hypothetical protein